MSNKLTSVETEVRRIYDEVNKYADAHGGVEHGLNVLYGPPIPDPTVFLVSMQGGGADRNRQRTWPAKLLYIHDKHCFGSRLQSDFKEAGLGEVLERRTVATNIAFPQANPQDNEFAKWRRQEGSRQWIEKSLQWVEELIRLMPPRVILTYGEGPFRYLIGRKKITPVEQTTWKPTSPAAQHNTPIALVGCGHLMRGATKAQRKDAMQRVRAIASAR